MNSCNFPAAPSSQHGITHFHVNLPETSVHSCRPSLAVQTPINHPRSPHHCLRRSVFLRPAAAAVAQLRRLSARGGPSSRLLSGPGNRRHAGPHVTPSRPQRRRPVESGRSARDGYLRQLQVSEPSDVLPAPLSLSLSIRYRVSPSRQEGNGAAYKALFRRARRKWNATLSDAFRCNGLFI